MPDDYVYVLNTGQTQSVSLNHTYANKHDAFPDTAFSNASVNPIIKNPGISHSKTNYNGASANFFEIRIAPTNVGTETENFTATKEPLICGHKYDTVVNRIMPTTNKTTLANYVTNKQITQSNRLRAYDAHSTPTGDLLAGSTGPGIDLEIRDYFVLINPQVTGDDGAVSIRPHFAKITKIISYDIYGDGFEFEPKYPNTIPKDTNFEIYEGPKVDNTNVIAVSYGLRGNTTSSETAGAGNLTDKYDISNTVSRPTWYFYNDRLQNKNQLDYNTKYMLTSMRYFHEGWESFGGTGLNGADGNYHNTKTVSTSGITWHDNDKGHSVWIDGSGGIKKFVGNIVSHTTNQITLDEIREDYPTASEVTGGSTAATLYRGRTVHQSIFLTEKEYGTIINDLGRFSHDATLIDTMRDKDVTESSGNAQDYDDSSNNYQFNPTLWVNAFRNYKRNIDDKSSNHSSYNSTGGYSHLHADLTGAKRHLYYKSSKLKNNSVATVIDASVNYPKNKMTQVARVKALDHSGIQHLKLKEDQSFTIRTSIHEGQLSEYELPYDVDSVSDSGTYKLKLRNLVEGFDCRNDSFIKVNDIIRVAGIYYVVSAIAAPAVSLDEQTQLLTVNKSKSSSDTVFSNMSSIDTFSGEKAYIRAWNGGLAGSFPIDTEAVYSSNSFKRLTMNGRTVSKPNTSLYNNRLVILSPEYLNHNIPIDYGDSIHKQIKLDPDFVSKKYYQSTSISPIYYLSGSYSIDEEIFSGKVEDVNSKNSQGMVSYEITGRDKISKLLSNTTNKNLNHTDDIIYSTLLPMIDETTNATATVNAKGTKVYIDGNSSGIKQHDLVFTNNNKLIGEVNSIGAGTNGGVGTVDGLNPIGSCNSSVDRTNCATNYVSGSGGTGLTVNIDYINVGGTNLLSAITVHTAGSNYSEDDELQITNAGDRNGYSSISFKVNALDSNSNNTTLTLKDDIYQSVAKDATVKLFSIVNDANHHAGTKSLATNTKATIYQTDLTSAADKGLVFVDGQKIVLADVDTNVGSRSTTLLDLPYTSSTGSVSLDSSLGYDFIGIKGTKTLDSKFAYKLGTENDGNISKNTIHTLNSPNYYSVVDTIIKEGDSSTFTLAPTFPIVLGSIETNTSDNRLSVSGTNENNSYLYLVNRNIPSGGFIHTLQDNVTTHYGPKQTLKYHDLQLIKPGEITKSYSSVYTKGNISQKILGAAPSYSINGKGELITPTTTSGIDPIEGSNLIDDAWNVKYNELTGAYKFKIATNTKIKIPQHYPKIQVDNQGDITNPDNWDYTSVEYNSVSRLINKDPRTQRYELMALGDIYPESKLRYNHLGNDSDTVFTNYGMLLEASPSKGNLVSHSNYTGSSSELIRKDNSYQKAQIDDASITPSNIKRWGIMRLVEATFDWHFNPIDLETMISTEEYDKIENFRYPRFSQPIDLQRDVDVDDEEGEIKFYATGTTTLTDTTFYPGDLIYAYSGSLLAMYLGATHPSNGTNSGTTTVTVTGNTDSDYVSSDWKLFTESMDGVASYVIRNNYYYDTSHNRVEHNFSGLMPFNLYADENGRGLDEVNNYDFYMNNIYLVGGNLNKSYLDYTDNVDNRFNTHNIFVPMISSLHRSQESGVERKRYFSAFHDVPQWEDDSAHWTGTLPIYHHTSRVLAALSLETFGEGEGTAGLAHYNNGTPSNHIYDNCIANFRNFHKISGDSVGGISSAPLSLDTSARYINYKDDEGDDIDQHARNIMITRKDRNKAFIGTKTDSQLLFGKTEINNKTNHFDISSQDGDAFLYNTQMAIKPRVNLENITSTTLSSHGCSLSSTTLKFQMNDNSTHHWVSFMPDLTGYYLVAEQIEDGSRLSNIETTTWSSVSGNTITVASTDGFPSSGKISITGSYTESDGSGGTNTVNSTEIVSYTGKTSSTFTGCIFDTTLDWNTHTSGTTITQLTPTKTGVPAIITKIKDHTLEVTSGYTTHTLTLDTAITTASHGVKFRLMKISETTFDETPEYIDVLKMHESGLQYNTIPFNLRTGEVDGLNVEYREALYSMYVLLDIDTLNTDTLKTVDRRTISSSKVGFTDGQAYQCYITDGYNSETKTLTATVSSTQLKFDYDGTLSGNGVVSFGETFTVDTPTKIEVTPERVYLGTTYSVGTDAQTAIENVLGENEITVDSSEKDVTYTGAIVASDMGEAATTITLNSAVTTLSDGDSIYNQDGKFIGVINSGSATTTLTLKDTGSDSTIDVYYRPKAGEEITKYTKRPFILNTKFSDTDVFTAVNFLAAKKGLEYTYKGEKILVNNVDDYNTRRRFTLRYRDGTNLISVENNTSLFDKANKVIVIGDNVRAIAQKPNTGNDSTIKHIDSNIKDVKEAKIKAEQLLVLHNKPSKKVTLTLEKNGELKLMKPGDIITLNFPNHNIPADDYIIFEIENAMSNIATVTVGTFNKTIAERLAEMNIEREGGFSTLLTKEVTSTTISQFSFEDLEMKEQSLKWQITSPSGITLGWTTLMGWTNTLQHGTDTITTEEIEL